MKVAVVERFPDPSRRCDPELVAEPADEMILWDLAPDAGSPPPRGAAQLARALPAWMRTGAPPTRLWRYARACHAMRGRRRIAFLRVPGWIRRARAHDLDAITCFSRDGFPLIELLAEDAGLPVRELLTRGTQYFGEFAFELLAVVPYAHWLCEQGRLEFTISTEDTRALYYFSPRHVERATPRRYVPITEYPAGETGRGTYDPLTFPAALDTTCWSPPPYRDAFRDDRFAWPKPLVVVSNKSTAEPYLGDDAGANSIPLDVLLVLIGQLRNKFSVVYNRPREQDIVGDHDESREIGDIEAIEERFPDVMTIQQLHAAHPDLGFNELQLRLFAGCERFVSVLGGSSYLASYFGGTNIVFARAGWEIDCGAYENWFDEFSGADVVAVRTPAELLRVAVARFLGDD